MRSSYVATIYVTKDRFEADVFVASNALIDWTFVTWCLLTAVCGSCCLLSLPPQGIISLCVHSLFAHFTAKDYGVTS